MLFNNCNFGDKALAIVKSLFNRSPSDDVITPPSGYAFVNDDDGAYLIDDDGSFLISEV